MSDALNNKNYECIAFNVADRIKAARVLFNQTQADVGRIIGVSYQQVQKYEQGKSVVPAVSLFMLACHYKISVEWFFQDLRFSGSRLEASNDALQLREIAKMYSSIRDREAREKLRSLAAKMMKVT